MIDLPGNVLVDSLSVLNELREIILFLHEECLLNGLPVGNDISEHFLSSDQILRLHREGDLEIVEIDFLDPGSEDVAFIVDLIQLELNLILGKCVVEFDPAGESVALYSADHVLFHHAQDLHCADRLPLERPLYFLAQLVKELLLIEFLGNARVCKRMRQFLLNELQHVNHVALVFRLSQMRRIVIQIQVVNRLWPLQDVLHQVLVLARTIQSIARYLFRQVII